MSQEFIRSVEREYMKAEAPKFEVGDTVDVHVKIMEGGKERIQVFTGTVIGVRGRGINRKVTVRRIVAGEGVERIFPVHSPAITKIDVVRSGVARKSKLYYLRDRIGKSTRLKERRAKRAVHVVGEETIAEKEAREAEAAAKIKAAEEAKAAEKAAQAKAAEEAKAAEKAKKAE
jgi:large subunit ribosomal protein L19